MSIVHLSSCGQSPSNFWNEFPQGINLKPNSEVRCLGYSGVLTDFNYSYWRDNPALIVIEKGINDTFVVYHGELADGSDPADFQQIAFEVKIPEGTYQMPANDTSLQNSTSNRLCYEIERALNISDNVSNYYSKFVSWTPGAPPATLCGWVVSFSGTTTGSNWKINLIECQNRRQDGGIWEQYSNQLRGKVVQGATPGAATDLYPATGGDLKGGIFVNTRAGYLGSVGTAPGSGGAGAAGYTMSLKVATTNTFKDFAVTHGVTPRGSLTTYEYLNNDTQSYADRKPNIARNPARVPNGLTDCFYPEEPLMWSTFGMTINPETGQVGTFNCAMTTDGGDAGQVPGALKQHANRRIDWHSTILDLSSLGTARLCMCPRFNSITGGYQMDMLFDNNTGTYVFLKAYDFGSYDDKDATQLFAAGQVFHTCQYDPKYVSATSALASMLTTNKWDNEVTSAADLDPVVPATLVYMPIKPDLMGVPQRLFNSTAEFSKRCNAFGRDLGFNMVYDTQLANAANVGVATSGWVSTGPYDQAKYTAAHPLIITCPTLPIDGYIGSSTFEGQAGGGGQQAPILAVANLRNNVSENGFSGLTQEVWLKLNNEYNLRLDRLNIRCVDQTNREYDGLLPDFSCWLQFREPSKRETPREDAAVGDRPH